MVPRLRDEAVAYYQTAFKAFRDGELKVDRKRRKR
jgi:hypothetical protein